MMDTPSTDWSNTEARPINEAMREGVEAWERRLREAPERMRLYPHPVVVVPPWLIIDDSEPNSPPT